MDVLLTDEWYKFAIDCNVETLASEKGQWGHWGQEGKPRYIFRNRPYNRKLVMSKVFVYKIFATMGIAFTWSRHSD